MGRAGDIEIEDLIADWKVRRTALECEISAREELRGVRPALAITKLRRVLFDLDRQIAQYAMPQSRAR